VADEFFFLLFGSVQPISLRTLGENHCFTGRIAAIYTSAVLERGDKKVKKFFCENIKLKNKCPFIEKGRKT
jgi:hypothetical protein